MSKIDKPAKQRITFEHDEGRMDVMVPDLQTLLDLFNTEDQTVAGALLMQASSALGTGNEALAQRGREFMVAMIEDLGPRDAIERMLVVQMAATHASMMQVSRRLNDADILERHEVFERSFNRLGRTFAAQVEALRKHRNGGQSKVTVEHVTVNEGGQAIVGSVRKS